MADNRDFKGVWIPKEIWLNEELTWQDKIILTEIDSLDNEEHCIAGNDYLAKFCQCSERKVSESISKLTKLGLIEVISFDGRHRKIASKLNSIALSSIEGSKICESESQNLQSINKDTKKEENKTNTIVLVEKKSKPNLYQKCFSAIEEFTDDTEVRDCLDNYLRFRLEVKDKPLYANQFKGILNKLRELTESKTEALQIIQQSIDKGYLSFYPITRSTYNNVKSAACEANVSCATMSEEEQEAQSRFIEQMREAGKQVEF